jgi:hypothetical protein
MKKFLLLFGCFFVTFGCYAKDFDKDVGIYNTSDIQLIVYVRSCYFGDNNQTHKCTDTFKVKADGGKVGWYSPSIQSNVQSFDQAMIYYPDGTTKLVSFTQYPAPGTPGQVSLSDCQGSFIKLSVIKDSDKGDNVVCENYLHTTFPNVVRTT